MNQKLIALAVAAAIAPMTAVAADVTFSGVLRGVVDFTNQEDNAGNKNDMKVDVNRARLRVDAMQKLDGGMVMNGYMRIQNGGGGTGVTVGQTGIYLDGSFGSIGIQGVGDSGNFGDTLGHLDIFETGAIVNGSASVFEQGILSPNTLWYSSPDFSGFKIKLAALTDNVNQDSGGTLPAGDQKAVNADVINPRVTYTAGPLFVALGVNQVKSKTAAYGGSDKYTRTNFGAKYSMSTMMFGLSYENSKEDISDKKHTAYGASFSTDIDKISLRVAASAKKDKGPTVTAANEKGRAVAAGIDYKLGKGAKVFAETGSLSKELANSGVTPKSSTFTQLGMLLSF